MALGTSDASGPRCPPVVRRAASSPLHTTGNVTRFACLAQKIWRPRALRDAARLHKCSVQVIRRSLASLQRCLTSPRWPKEARKRHATHTCVPGPSTAAKALPIKQKPALPFSPARKGWGSTCHGHPGSLQRHSEPFRTSSCIQIARLDLTVSSRSCLMFCTVLGHGHA